MIIIDGKAYDRPLTEEEFEALWDKMKEVDYLRAEKFSALPKEEKERINKLTQTPFAQRMQSAICEYDIDIDD